MNAVFTKQEQLFYMTELNECPYKPEQYERKVFTRLQDSDTHEFHNYLSSIGFRRSHSFAYLPICPNCKSCVPVRVVASKFKPKNTQKRIINANLDIAMTRQPALATQEQFELFVRYLESRHLESDMNKMNYNEYCEMVENSPVNTAIYEFHTSDGKLVAVILIDIMQDGLSAVYSFYNPDMPKRSLGKFIIMRLIEETHRMKLDYFYLGYWIKECQNMAYKIEFKPIETLGATGWNLLQD